MKKKVVLISESMGGGLRKHILQLVEFLNKEKYDIYLIHGTNNVDEVFLEEKKKLSDFVSFIECSSFTRNVNLNRDIRTFIHLHKEIKRINPEIVHCHSSKAGVLGRFAAKVNKTNKIFYTPHAFSFLSSEFTSLKRMVFILIERLFGYIATDIIFCVSKSEYKEAIKENIAPDRKIKVIYNGLPEIKEKVNFDIRRNLQIDEKSVLIGNNARLNDQKNPFLFLEIAKCVISENNNFHFIWIGDGPLKEDIEKKISELNLESNVHLLGNRTDSELIVAQYDVFLSTSNFEGLPYAVIESLRAGVPVLSTKIVGMDELINKETGYYLPKIFNGKNIVDIIKILMKLDQINIQKYFKDNFSLQEMIKKMETYYDN
ncbi:glycosyltransferase [Enterococcus casseliflavus]|uniref:glycosyltransferase n=1 Tax=Enterococcus casseliflavus TaxID=37734 RepID=UPI00295465FF|nr:glycosyltransferase [Enterococcus casseliflavus]MDV7751305.1 glycosyltransferase [Enterococcus casseliflavus]